MSYPEKVDRIIYSDQTKGFAPPDWCDLALAAADQAGLTRREQIELVEICEAVAPSDPLLIANLRRGGAFPDYSENAKPIIYGNRTTGFSVLDFSDLAAAALDQAGLTQKQQVQAADIFERVRSRAADAAVLKARVEALNAEEGAFAVIGWAHGSEQWLDDARVSVSGELQVHLRDEGEWRTVPKDTGFVNSAGKRIAEISEATIAAEMDVQDEWMAYGPTGIPISPEPFQSEEAANRALDRFVEGFRSQEFFSGPGFRIPFEHIRPRCTVGVLPTEDTALEKNMPAELAARLLEISKKLVDEATKENVLTQPHLRLRDYLQHEKASALPFTSGISIAHACSDVLQAVPLEFQRSEWQAMNRIVTEVLSTAKQVLQTAETARGEAQKGRKR